MPAMLYNHLAKRCNIVQVVIEKPEPLKRFLSRRVRRLGMATVVGQVAFQGLVYPRLASEARERIGAIKASHALDDLAIPQTIVTYVESVNDARVAEVLARYEHDAVVVFGTRIIGRKILESSAARFINLHTGITPKYRGVHGGYWALVNNDMRFFGVTVHLIDQGIDTGEIIAQGVISPGVEDNFVTYPYLQLACGLPLLERAVHSVANNALRLAPVPPKESRLWSHPTLWQYVFYRILHSVK